MNNQEATKLDLPIAETLKLLPFFNSLPEAIQLELAQHANKRNIEAGQVIYLKGDEARYIFFITKKGMNR